MSLAPVLYVEDEENDVFFMQRAFATNAIAHPLHITRNGEEALAYLQACVNSGQVPCLILLDLNLPLISGFEVLAWLRQSPVLKNVPVCVLSSSDQPRDTERAKQHGANEYQMKPTSALQLCAWVQSLKNRLPAFNSNVVDRSASNGAPRQTH